MRKEVNNMKSLVQLELSNLECTIMGKIDLRDSKYQIIELLNEKIDKNDFEKIKAEIINPKEFEELKEMVQNDERLGKITLILIPD